MKIIVVGCGKTGHTIAKVLSAKKDIHVTTIDKDSSVFDVSVEQLDVMYIVGNAANEKILIEAGAKDADLIVCTTNADEVNVLCCIMAERLGTKHSVARVRNPEYMLEFNNLWKDLGIDMTINPERQTARKISRLLRYPTADRIDTFVDDRVELVSLKVAEAPEFFVGKSVAQIFDKKMEMILAVVERGKEVLIPNGDFVFEYADMLKVLGQPSQIMNFLTHLKKTPKKQNVMVIGGGKITYYLAELLKRHTTKTNIKIIEKDHHKCEALCEALSEINRHCMFINGDGSKEDLLIAEEIDGMDAFVCLTDRDEENSIISLYALQRGVSKVITKVNHIHHNMIKNLGLRSIVSPQNITASTIERYVDGLSGAIGREIVTIHEIASSDDANTQAIEFHVNKVARCLDTPIKDLMLKDGVLIGCIVRNDSIIIPSGETQLRVDDRVIIISKNNVVNELDGILKVK